MSQKSQTVDLVRTWKDPQYRSSLPQEVQDRLPQAPANLDQLTDEQLAEAAGAYGLPVSSFLDSFPLLDITAGAGADVDRAEGIARSAVNTALKNA